MFVNASNETSKSLNTLRKSRVHDMVILYIKQFTNKNDKYVENIVFKTSTVAAYQINEKYHSIPSNLKFSFVV